MPDSVLINNIIDIANCLVILHPSSIGYFQLSRTNELLHFLLHLLIYELVPIFEKNNFSDKILALRVLLKSCVHRIEDSFGISLIHLKEEVSRPKVNIFELVIGIEPEGIQMRMERNQKFFIVRAALLTHANSQHQKQADEPRISIFKIHLSQQSCQQLKKLFASQQFYLMEVQHIQQQPRIDKINKSSLQFRQLIDSLRNNLKANRTPIQFQGKKHQILQQKEVQAKDESTLMVSQNKEISHNNNFLLNNQSQNVLKPRQKVQVGDRDKLKKKPVLLDSNPQLQFSHSKIISKLENSTQFSETKFKNQLNTQKFQKNSVNVSTQYGVEDTSLMNSAIATRSNNKVGQIFKQNFKMDSHQALTEEIKNIKDISENLVIQYCGNQKKITQKSTPSQIFSFFANLIISCGIVIKSPHIKKYKNCIYFGHNIEKDLIYQGFLYFYDGKIYYGQFYNGFKHGLGVEINFNENIKIKGEFKEGHKTGKFYVQKPTQRYIGYLQNGLYQGEGRLMKEDYVYEGMFDKGEKNGYGEEVYPKTGVRLTGNFRNGVLQKAKHSKSIPQIRNKPKTFSLNKQRQKDRLQVIRKKSFQKHNFRMNKIRERSFRQTEQQMPSQPTQQYNQSKIHFNTSKLDVYRQPVQRRLPKICNQFEFSNDIGSNMQSIGNRQGSSPDIFPPALKPKRLDREREGMQRVATNQLQEPLPTPCLTVLRSRR